jgi:uncharacterized membrane protein
MEKIITNICAIYYGITMLIGLLVCIIDSIFLLTINKRFFYFVNIDFFLINLLLCPSIMLILIYFGKLVDLIIKYKNDSRRI